MLTTSVLLLRLFFVTVVVYCQEITFDGCNIEDFYFGLNILEDNLSRLELQDLLIEKHRRILPYTDSDGDDVWKALIDLDAGDTAGTVRLIYSQRDIPALPHGTTDTWNREHLWPKSLGVDYSGADFTDIHHLRPADWNVNSARNNLYFGECGGEDDFDDDCQSPAAPEAAADTAKNSQVFQPPAVTRGDIARALFYMDVRYSGEDGVDLMLTDCPTDEENGDDLPSNMAYLSTLLEWHEQDPVSETEILRNNRACEYWQGNRNPFVDYPELVEVIFGLPQSRPFQCDTKNDTSFNSTTTTTSFSPTTAPLPSNSDNQEGAPTKLPTTATLLSPGDVLVVAMHSDDPDLVALVALEDVPAHSEILITDNAWTGSNFRTNEGTMSLRVADGGIPRGTIFGYGQGLLYGDTWSSASDKGFSLSAVGDTVLVYWKENVDQDDETIQFLGAFSFNGPWQQSGLDADAYGTDSSALPDSLVDFEIHFPHSDNFVYTGPTEGTKSVLQSTLLNTSHWTSSNSEPLFQSSTMTSFEVQPSSATMLTCTPVWLTLTVIVPIIQLVGF